MNPQYALEYLARDLKYFDTHYPTVYKNLLSLNWIATGRVEESLKLVEAVLETPCDSNFVIRYKNFRIFNEDFVRGKLFQYTVSLSF